MTSPGPRLTRRTLLGSAAAAGAGLLLGPVAGAVAAERHGGRVFSRWIGELLGQSPVIDAGRRFALAGLQWSAPTGARIELRTRVDGGPWSPWALASVTGHDGDGARDGKYGEPLWSGAADMIQLRSAGRVRGLMVHFVARAGGLPAADLASTASLPLATPILDAGPGQPPIIARSAWADGHAPPEFPSASYGEIKLAFVHHTVNPNGYGAGDVPALLLAIFDYHRYVRGFFDIAYNFIIDAFGRIWEARAGGIDEPVVGAHAGGYNQESTGVAVLGTFSYVVPPPAAINALQHLLAWKLALHGIPSLGKVRVEVDPADAFYTPFRPGQLVLLPRVAGHRQGCLTDCPGNAFFARLPSIRPQIAALEGVPAALTLAVASTTVAPATALAISGRLATLDGTPLAGATLEIQSLANNHATTIATATTAADGTWRASVVVQRNAVLRALHAEQPASASNVVYVGVAPVITLALSSSSPVRVSGTVNPASRRHVLLDVYRLRNGRRHLIHSKRLPVVGGRFSARALIGVPSGTYVLIARTIPGGGFVPGASPPLHVGV
ncbi:MAG: N-acetylmuramoyl-L-alanine amidase [Solirubrobacteraceae bacterium]